MSTDREVLITVRTLLCDPTVDLDAVRAILDRQLHPYTYTGAAKKIVDRSGPMHYRDITKEALVHGLIKTKGKTPDATMGARLAVAVIKGDTFVRTERGVYGLKGRDD